MGCNRPKKDWTDKIGTPPSETDYHRSNSHQKKIGEQRKEREEPHTLVNIAQKQECGYAQHEERGNKVEKSPAVLGKFLRKISSVKSIPSDLFQMRTKQQSAMVINDHIRCV